MNFIDRSCPRDDRDDATDKPITDVRDQVRALLDRLARSASALDEARLRARISEQIGRKDEATA